MNNFLHLIYIWYKEKQRSLPWRETKDPYKIWISEIILQQTKVAQGNNYYLRFIEKFPTIKELALASEDEVLKLWQGLGYYSRARNLHAAAKHIQNNLGGTFPTDYNDILKLKGVGPYTAAAISSIAFELPFPVIDGNIYRVFSRYFGITSNIDKQKGKNEIQKIANELMPKTNTGFHNQALMEFGALQCIPKSPDCVKCPISETCYALKNHCITKLPVKEKKKKQTNRYFNYYYIDCGKFTFLEKRKASDIWRNLYQFPLIETTNRQLEVDILKSPIPFLNKLEYNIKSVYIQKKHVLSHQNIFATLTFVELTDCDNLSNGFIKVNKKDISKFAVPKLLEQFIVDLKID